MNSEFFDNDCWDVDGHLLPVHTVQLSDPVMQDNIFYSVYLLSSELFGILRNGGVSKIWLTRTEPVYLRLDFDIFYEYYNISTVGLEYFFSFFAMPRRFHKKNSWKKCGF